MTTTTIPTVPEALREAARLIEEYGLANGEWVGRKGCLCTIAATAVACGLPDDVFGDDYIPPLGKRMTRAVEVVEAMAKHVGVSLPLRESRSRDMEWWFPVTEWSDTRTADEVVTAMRAAAEGAES